MKTLSINRKPTGDLLKSKRVTPAQEILSPDAESPDAATPPLLASSGKQIPTAGMCQAYEDLKRGLKNAKSKMIPAVFEKRPDLQAISTFWPKMFTPENPRPLVIGAYELLVEDSKNRELGITAFHINKLLQAYCGRDAYLASYLTAEYRVGLDGSPAGEITDEARAAMQKRSPQLTLEAKKSRIAMLTQQVKALEEQYDFSIGADSPSSDA